MKPFPNHRAAHVGRAVYELLGLQSFYTAGDVEVRAWPIVAGTKAPQAVCVPGIIDRRFCGCVEISLAIIYKSASHCPRRPRAALKNSCLWVR